MTYEEVKNLKPSKIIVNNDLKDLTKECLSIVKTSTLKDNEILMYINAGILDLERQGIDVETNIQNNLIQAAIIMFVKSNFGMTNIKEKQLSKDTYEKLCSNMSLSSQYQKKEVDNNA